MHDSKWVGLQQHFHSGSSPLFFTCHPVISSLTEHCYATSGHSLHNYFMEKARHLSYVAKT